MNKYNYESLLNIPSLAKYLKDKIIFKTNKNLSLWVPSRFNVISIIMGISLIFILEIVFKNLDCYLINYLFSIIYKNTNIINNDLLINIHTGIWAVVIGLAFFVAQSLSDIKEPDKGRVLLQKSFFFPLLIAELVTSITFLLKGFQGSKLILSLVLSILTVISLYRTIKVLLNDYEFYKSKVRMLMGIIKGYYIKLAARDFSIRISNNILFDATKKLPNFKFNPFNKSDSNTNSISIYSDKEGEISDISLLKFKIFAENLNKKFEKFSPEDIKNKNETQEIKASFECTLLVKMYDEIQYTDKLFIITPIRELSKYQIIEIEALFSQARKIFSISKKENLQVKARYEILKIKQKCLDGISNENAIEVKNSIDFYLELINELYEFHKNMNIVFEGKNANDEAQSFFDPLFQLDWLVKDIRVIYKAGVLNSNSEINLLIIHLPIKIARNAIAKKDHLFFNSFIRFQSSLYYYYSKQKLKSKLIFDRLFRHLTETASYFISPLISESKDNIKHFYSYSDEIFLQFNYILKSTITNFSLSDFKVFLKKVNSLFNYIDLSNLSYEEQDAVHSYIKNRNDELFFGLASWITYKLEVHNNDEELKTLKLFYSEVEKFITTDFKKFSELFLQCLKKNDSDFWGWDTWILMEKGEDSGAIAYDPNQNLKGFYITHSLIILNNISDLGNVSKYIIKLDENSKYHFSESSDLRRLLVTMNNNTKEVVKLLEKIFDESISWLFTAYVSKKGYES